MVIRRELLCEMHIANKILQILLLDILPASLRVIGLYQGIHPIVHPLRIRPAAIMIERGGLVDLRHGPPFSMSHSCVNPVTEGSVIPVRATHRLIELLSTAADQTLLAQW
jgi:hypothetical protein